MKIITNKLFAVAAMLILAAGSPLFGRESAESAEGSALTEGSALATVFSHPLEWRIGAEISAGWVVPTNSFLEGKNPADKRVTTTFAGDLRADFSYSPASREAMLYRGIYQGIGVGANTFFAPKALGAPVTLYVYQGAQIARPGQRVWLGYEWQFGVAMGWRHFNDQSPQNNAAVSTAVTARMGIGVKLHYEVAPRWELTLGAGANHYSNGNTSWPNAGVNSIGVTIGAAYTLNPLKQSAPPTDPAIEAEADRHTLSYDIMAYGAWRKRAVKVGDPAHAQLCPGRFGVVGLEFSPLYRLNRLVSIGPALDLQWDESAGIAPYWVDGTTGSDIKFERPPFGKRVSVGVSAHAELTMPIFSLNGGVGYQIVSPNGDRRFYQTLSLKTFVTRHLYLNVGYSLGRFKDPRNLMLGIGLRL